MTDTGAHRVAIVTSSISGRLLAEGNRRCAAPDGTVKQKMPSLTNRYTIYNNTLQVLRSN
jgi:hypothetical protein